MSHENLSPADRRPVAPALERSAKTGGPAVAIELPDGTIITGKTGDLLGASAAALMNSLKHLAGIPHEQKVLSPESLSPIQTLKIGYLGSKNPRLHTDEMLIALSANAAENEGGTAMKPYFLVSLCKNGILGGGLVADDAGVLGMYSHRFPGLIVRCFGLGDQ